MTVRDVALALAILAAMVFTSLAAAQSSSLYIQPATMPAYGPTIAPAPGGYGVSRGAEDSSLSPALRVTSFTSVPAAEPRQFAMHDLVTIIIREFSRTDLDASLETEKDATWDGAITAFPRLNVSDLLDFQLSGSDLSDPIELAVENNNKWEGEGEYSRSASISDRITARIIDVKPNGLLVLEARKHIKTDREELTLVLTGTCRAEDVNIDNTVLSTQLYDLQLDKQHKGDLRKTTHKGIITRVLEALFNF